MHGTLRGGILGVKGKDLNGMGWSGVAQNGCYHVLFTFLSYSE
jgi:hypothetical protein